MKAAILEQFNHPLTIKNLEIPTPQPNEVLVKVKASGLNPLDIKIQQGAAAHAQVALPAVPGIDMAGIIERPGDNVRSFKAGDEVFGMAGGIGKLQGTLAEYVSVDADLLALKPANLSFKQAAAIPLVFITAWQALANKGKVTFGQTVLVHGGAGGVGHVAVQLALAKGAGVFATVSHNNRELIESYGAIPIDYTRLSVEQYVNEYTDGLGFDLVLDTIGGSVLDDSFKAVKRNTGHVVSILGWGTHSLAPLSFRSATYSGVFTLYPLLSGEERASYGNILREATKLIEAGKLRPFVSSTHYTLETVNNAYADLANKSISGKIVVEI
ncbi:quinone oxidoreductase [Niastella vici]|uniref:Quinone oxidoreductase n=1 Tax=Niastella vici TaxID=1703345 RepID=A0A1V9G7L4_9BACT|nr:zinc-dependent alcohol dehydrogenase family protein [Niastella vici]OQP66534.1 quinone oxidoreductase [Niastella vici]